ncbi:hypothetical protein INS49_007092 [Diaporthe citri]|uniref:uncharacterized protein n=1 Tax=Diaporthe citri TaxID=83186 RepID=UPI001C81B645|nr:uncharacterized protein INS49_007092 [Diaporthe citri]KAG6365481.1 hypothetical protein INS49_007092 [Diaporthe citri]
MVHQQRPVPTVAPMSLPPQMQRPMPQIAASFPPQPPHPPRHVIPSHFQRPVVVSDIRAEGVTEGDIREDLSDYVILRFEKIEPYDEYDSEGEEVKASWDNCIRRRIAGVDKVDARKEVRRLNKEDGKKGRTLLEKQNDLGPKQQDQLAKAQRELSLEEYDPRFHTVLAQIDYTLKPVMQKREKVYTRRSNTKRKIQQKRRYERTSITAYFKRCPKPTQIPSELARSVGIEKQRESEAMQIRHHQAPEQHMVPHPRPQLVQQPQPGPMYHPQAAPMRSPGPMQGQVHRAQGMPMHQSHPVQGLGRPHTPIRVEVDHRKDRNHRSRHSRSSDSSECSDYGSGSELGSESTLVTEPSHSSDSHKGRKHHDQKRRSLRYLEEPRNFGVDVYRPGRRHSLVEEPSYIVTGSGARVPIIQVPVPPRKAAIPVESLDQIQAEAYHAGRSDQKAAFRHTLGDAESLDFAARRYKPRYAPRPEIINEGLSPTRIRHVTSSEVGRQLEDNFQRLRIDRDSRYHDDLSDSIHL